MADLKRIRQRIQVTKETIKVTNVMEVVSASKFEKSKAPMAATKRYIEEVLRTLEVLKIDEVLWEQSTEDPFVERALGELYHFAHNKHNEMNDIFIIAVGGNKGLCGNLNTSVAKSVLAIIKHHLMLKQNEVIQPEVYIYAIGTKMKRLLQSVVPSSISINIIDGAKYYDLCGTKDGAKELINHIAENFLLSKSKEIDLVFHKSENIISHHVVEEKIFEKIREEFFQKQGVPTKHDVDTSDNESCNTASRQSGKPSSKEDKSLVLPLWDNNNLTPIVDSAVRQYFYSSVMHALMAHKMAEQALRMNSMSSATKNGKDLLRNLTLTYNKVRQSNITREIIDIIGGTEASVRGI